VIVKRKERSLSNHDAKLEKRWRKFKYVRNGGLQKKMNKKMIAGYDKSFAERATAP
jgi:hypothetical protein